MTVAADQDRLPYFEHQQNAQVGCKQFLEERAWPSDESLCALERTLWQMSCVHGYEHHGSRSDEPPQLQSAGSHVDVLRVGEALELGHQRTPAFNQRGGKANGQLLEQSVGGCV